MSFVRRLTFAAAVLSVATARGQSVRREPHIGYLYPAGVRQGSTAQIIAGGQYLAGPVEVYVSGKGVRASVVRYIRPIFNLQRAQRSVLLKRMAEVREKRLEEAGVGSAILARMRSQAERAWAWMKKENVKAEDVKLPDHQLLSDLDSKSLRELMHVRYFLFFPRNKRQLNRQLAESVLVEVTVDPNAPPGDRELRIRTRGGLTNPVVFQVGQMPEVRELEPNDRKGGIDLSRAPILGRMPKVRQLLEPKPVKLPVLLNGQIMPGDVDRFVFRAREGQKIVIEASARRLVPYLADAVPGWFQATLALYDADGQEVAFADDYRFNPDPVLFYRIPKDGEYELEIRDAVYRGREDFVYRIAVSEQPFVTQAFPLGGREGAETLASIDGWNVARKRLPLDTGPGDGWIRYASCRHGGFVSNPIPYAVDTLPECEESESNDTMRDAQRIGMPKIINGRIARAGDVDMFRIEGDAGDRIVAEVSARRLSSPLDSLLRLIDASGKVLHWNDDHVLKDEHLHIDRLGLITHHADSYLSAELPKKGAYYVQLSDAQHHGSKAHAYRLRISAPRPDFALRATPSSLHARPGATVPICVYAMRKDGFGGEIEVRVKAPSGFRLTGGRIPAGCHRMRMTLTAPNKAPAQPVALKLEGIARFGGKAIRRPAEAADNVMQAFLYRHLVPAQEMLVAVRKQRWPAPPMTVAGGRTVRIPVGGSTRVRVRTGNRRPMKGLVLELNDPPEGLSLRDVSVVSDGLEFRLQADGEAVKSGFADNLIVEALREYVPKTKDGKSTGRKRRYSTGFLPAIPVEIVQK
ncbi:MAG: hypothetical protein AMK72_03035 [Planctomycetes bacterium SM23_25]|nr:MAG: hypothetical protein AMK72_03035 [Planctomycetes bacterium SM23_25]